MRATFNMSLFLQSLFLPGLIYSTQKAHFGDLHDYAQDANGNAYFGTGNPADNYDTTRVFSQTNLLTPKTFVAEYGLKNHYRTSTETGEWRDGEYYVDGGYQQNGVHGAHSTREDRASDNIDWSVLRLDGDFSATRWLIDQDSSDAEDFAIGKAEDLTGDGIIDAIVFDNGFVHGIGPGNGAEPGELLADSFNWAFFQQYIDGGNWDGESGELVFKITDTIEQPNPIYGLFFNHHVEQEMITNFGPMADPVGTIA